MRPVAGVDNLFIIPSGSPPPNPTELLGSARMDQILLDASHEVDMVIVDSPPSLVADYQVLSTKVDGVLIIIQPGRTHADTASAMLDQLARVNANTLGVVLNKIPRNSHHYGAYHYYSGYAKKGGYYYQADEQSQPQPQTENQLLGSLPQAEPYQQYPARATTQTDTFPDEFPPADVQPVRSYPKADVKPVRRSPAAASQSDELAKPRKDVLEEMYNAMRAQGRVNMVLPAQEIPAAREVPTKPRPKTEDFLPVVTPKYSIGKYEVEYTFTDNEFGKDEG
jgi:hypothetical protein